MRNNMQYERDSRKRPIRRTGERMASERMNSRKKFELFLAVICLLLVGNIATLLKLQSQIKGMNKSLNQVLSVMSIKQEDSEDDEVQTMAERDEVINPQYQAAPVNDTPVQTVDYVSLCGLSEVDKPVDRTPSQVLKRLKELAEDSETIAGIYQYNSRYTDAMLAALANNPEMADFVAHFPESDTEPTGLGLTDLEREQDFPLFLQWDPRWGYVSYGDESNVGLSGCGPTCLSMILYYLLGDESLTPDKIAVYSMENDYYMFGTGTTWKLLTDVPEMYGLSVSQPKASDWGLKNALDNGSLIICSMKAGDFTAGGHFIVIYGYDSEGYLVNDPNCVARSRMKWTYDQIGKQIKNVWVYSV